MVEYPGANPAHMQGQKKYSRIMLDFGVKTGIVKMGGFGETELRRMGRDGSHCIAGRKTCKKRAETLIFPSGKRRGGRCLEVYHSILG